MRFVRLMSDAVEVIGRANFGRIKSFYGYVSEK